MSAVETIGILSHETPPTEHMTATRTRALLGEAALQGVALRFFSARDCDVGAGRITATRLVDGAWQRVAMPPPPLVVAISRPVRPEQEAVHAWLGGTTRLLAFDTRDKEVVAGILAASPWSAYVIPEERLVAGRLEAQLAAWLSGGGAVVKRADGSLGVGLHFMVPGEHGGWTVLNDDRAWHGSAAEAAARVARAIRGRMDYRTYLVQRYVETRDALGQPATVRADIARRPDGGWDIYRLTARIAIGAKLVSNRARGSAMVDVESFLEARRLPDPAAKLAELRAFLIGAAETIAAVPGLEPTYELGIDLAMEPDGRFWFLEANQRPLTHGAEMDRAGYVISFWRAFARS